MPISSAHSSKSGQKVCRCGPNWRDGGKGNGMAKMAKIGVSQKEDIITNRCGHLLIAISAD